MNKIKLYLFFACILLVNFLKGQITLETPIHFSIENATPSEALNLLADQYDLGMAFSDDFFRKGRRINMHWENATLAVVLDEILKGAQVGYKLKNGYLTLFRKEKSLPKRYYTISGYVEDEANREKLIGVNVFHKPSGKWATTNEYGFYSITLPEGKTELRYSYLGCEERTEKIDLSNSRRVDIGLQPGATLTEIIVTPTADSAVLKTIASEGQLMPPNYTKVAPGVGGESDILGMALMMPGVQSGADGFGGLYVRGGEAGQNLMLLDGVPIYNPSHIMGIFSVFNSDAIRSAKLMKGQFPARYGGRVSSVFDVRSREGNQKEWNTNVGIGLISGKAMVEGPVFNKNGGLLLAGRLSHSNFLLDQVFRNSLFGNSDEYKFNFHDFNAKLHFPLSDRDRIYLSYYQGRDNFFGDSSFTFDDEEQGEETILNWGNEIAALRWNRIWGYRLFSNTTFTFSDYNYRNTNYFYFENDLDEDEDEFLFRDRRNRIQDWAVNTDFNFIPNPSHNLRFGIQLIQHNFEPYANNFDIFDAVDSEFDSVDIDILSELFEVQQFGAFELATYIEDDIKLNDKWRLNAGLRATAFLTERDEFANLEPRLSLYHQPTDNLALNIAASRMVQYIQQISFSGLSLPDDLWLPASDSEPPIESWLFEAGLNKAFKKKFELSLEGYYKRMNNLLAPLDEAGGEFIIHPDVSVEGVTVGDGESYGLEAMLQKNGKTGGWVSYTWARSNRHFPLNNESRPYAFQYDRRHTINLFAYHQLTSNLTFSMSWTYSSGNPEIRHQDPSFSDDFIDPFLFFNEGNKNQRRFKPYHRLDANVTYQIKHKKLQHLFKLGAYNVYNRANVAFYSYDFYDFNGIGYKPVTLLYFTPSLFYRVAF